MNKKIGSSVLKKRSILPKTQPIETKEVIKVVDKNGKTVADGKQIVEMERDIRYVLPKYPPKSKEAEMLREVRQFALGILTGGVTEMVEPQTLYEVRRIMETEGFKDVSKTLTSIAPLMMK